MKNLKRIHSLAPFFLQILNLRKNFPTKSNVSSKIRFSPVIWTLVHIRLSNRLQSIKNSQNFERSFYKIYVLTLSTTFMRNVDTLEDLISRQERREGINLFHPSSRSTDGQTMESKRVEHLNMFPLRYLYEILKKSLRSIRFPRIF